jgi:hypothetical protein
VHVVDGELRRQGPALPEAADRDIGDEARPRVTAGEPLQVLRDLDDPSTDGLSPAANTSGLLPRETTGGMGG